MVLLVDKYRPKQLSDVFGNVETVETLQSLLDAGNFPHLLFTGPPGTGKTTCAKIIAKKLINENYSERVLELNASDERGIDIVRDRIKKFAHKMITADGIGKIILLDEADSMTTAAQQAMRRIMETCVDTRFILICNTFGKIFEPIQSRCAVFKFDKLETNEIKALLLQISEKERIIMGSAIDIITNLSDGDMRQALNILQTCQYFENPTESTVLAVTGQPSPVLIRKIVEHLLSNNYEAAIDIFDTLWRYKYDPADIIQGFFRLAKNTDNYDILRVLGPYHMRIIDGVNQKIQFYSLFYDIATTKA